MYAVNLKSLHCIFMQAKSKMSWAFNEQNYAFKWAYILTILPLYEHSNKTIDSIVGVN